MRTLAVFSFILFICNYFCLGQATSVNNPFFKEQNFFSSSFEERNFNQLTIQINQDPGLFFSSFEPEGNKIQYALLQKTIQEEVSYLVQRRVKNNLRFLRKIFEHIHKIHLKKYRTYSTFGQLLNYKIFDCLTGTALYAMIFDEMGIRYDLFETANHSYLIVRLAKERVLFESTDPVNGFITGAPEIEATQQRYAKDVPLDFDNLLGMVGYKRTPGNTIKVYSEKITLFQLSGLYYYNQAVVYYNLKKYRDAVNTLEKAFSLHPSKRILNLLLVSVQEVLKEDNLGKNDLKKYIAKTHFYSTQGQGFFD